MKKNINKGVLISVFVFTFIIGIIFGGFSNTKITGYGIWGPWESHYNTPDWLLSGRGSNAVTEISVSPKEVFAGQPLTISIDPGMEGARRETKIYKINERGYGVLKSTSRRFGSVDINHVQRGGFEVFENKTFTYYTSHSWSPGLYIVKVFDFKSNQYVGDTFKIKYINPRSEDVIRSGFKKIIYGG